MKVLNPSILWFLFLVIPLLLVSYMKYQQSFKTYVLLGGNDAQKPLFTLRFILDQLCLYLFFIFTLLAFADIYFGKHTTRYANDGLDLVFVLDISNSMLATDEEPTRLEKAKAFASEAVYNLSAGRMGAVAFKGIAVPVLPLTQDTSSLTAFLRTAHSNRISAPGSNLSSGIEAALTLFDNNESHKKVILLLTDGEALSGNLYTAAQKAKKQAVTIYSIGLGKSEGIALFNESGSPVLDKKGNAVYTRLEEGALTEIARLTNGRYLGTNESAFNDLMTELRTLQNSNYRIEVEDQSLITWFIAGILFCLSLRMLIRSSKWQKLYGYY